MGLCASAPAPRLQPRRLLTSIVASDAQPAPLPPARGATPPPAQGPAAPMALFAVPFDADPVARLDVSDMRPDQLQALQRYAAAQAQLWSAWEQSLARRGVETVAAAVAPGDDLKVAARRREPTPAARVVRLAGVALSVVEARAPPPPPPPAPPSKRRIREARRRRLQRQELADILVRLKAIPRLAPVRE